jgi:hypothetical protein
MPTYTIPADATNYSLAALERARLVALGHTNHYVPSQAEMEVQAEADGLKFGGAALSSTNYDFKLIQDVPRKTPLVVLSNYFVRNDEAAAINLHVETTPR